MEKWEVDEGEKRGDGRKYRRFLPKKKGELETHYAIDGMIRRLHSHIL